jgi:hypothetical protein
MPRPAVAGDIGHRYPAQARRRVVPAEVAQLVEHRPEEAGVVSSNLTLGTISWGTDDALESATRAEVAQLVEHHLAKVRVAGSSPVFRSIPLSLARPDSLNVVRCPVV